MQILVFNRGVSEGLVRVLFYQAAEMTLASDLGDNLVPAQQALLTELSANAPGGLLSESLDLVVRLRS